MDTEHSKHLELWTRFLSGQTLSAGEESELVQALRTDPPFRDQVLRDQTLDWMLASLPQIDQMEDSFVDRVLKSCQSAEDTVAAERYPAIAAQPPVKSIRSPIEVIPPPVVRSSLPAKSVTGPPSGEVSIHVHAPSAANRLLRRRRMNMPLIAALACSLLVCLTAAALLLLRANRGEHDTPLAQDSTIKENTPSATDDDRARPDPEPGAGGRENRPASFITLTSSDKAVWRRTRNTGDRLGHEELQLLEGVAQLTFDDGAVIDLNGPASVRVVSLSAMELDHGRLSASIPPAATGFRVGTPTSQIVDLGTEFDVHVDDSGTTDVQVWRGEVVVAPRDYKDESQEWRLIADGLNQATFFERLAVAPRCPVASAARGASGRFLGVISVNGKSMQFDNADAFETVRQRVFSGFQSEPDKSIQAWSDFMATSRNIMDLQGSVEINGIEVKFGNMQEAMQLHQKLQDEMARRFSNGMQMRNHPQIQSFSGMLNINGQVKRFNSRAEYEAAKRELFGPAATFGAGNLDD